MEKDTPAQPLDRAPNPVFQPHRGREPGRGFAMVFLDLVVLVAAMAGAIIVRGAYFMEPFWHLVGAGPQGVYGAWSRIHTTLLLIQIAIIPMALFILGQYRFVPGRAHRGWSFERILAVVGGTHVAALIVFWLLRILYLPRTVVILDFAFVIVGLVAWRWYWERIVRRRLDRGAGLTNVLFVGVDDDMVRLAVDIVRHPYQHGRRIVGFAAPEGAAGRIRSSFEDVHEIAARIVHVDGAAPALRLEAAARMNMAAPGKHLIGVVGRESAADLRRALDSLGVEEVYVASSLPREFLVEALRLSTLRGVDVFVVPTHYPEVGPIIEPTRFGAFTVLALHRRPISKFGWVAKRGLDVVGALVGTILGLPIILLAAVAIKIENPRLPVFYRGMRVGYKGRQFRMWKLNTMVAEAQVLETTLADRNVREGPWFKVESDVDPRLTKVGRFLRKFTINELPQFWNVLTGEMSLVGPRPPIPAEVAKYLEYDSRYYQCLEAKPGITSLWAVQARDHPSFDARIELDIAYVQRWSIWLDLQILVRTLLTVVRRPEK